MDIVNTQDVFKDSGVPEYNFVESKEYFRTELAVNTVGKGLIIEGPSGIGKTSCITRILKDKKNVCILSALKKSDLEFINDFIENPKNAGTIIVDDFHRLDETTKENLTNVLKIGADESRKDFKLILIGINQAGDALVKLSPEIVNRLDVIRFENNPPDKIEELIKKGEDVLNIKIVDKQSIVDKSCGSFHIAQMLCKELCIENEIGYTCDSQKQITTTCEVVVGNQVKSLARSFEDSVKQFARGKKFRKRGNRPYLRLLEFLAESDNGSIKMSDIKHKHPNLKQSIIQITGKGYLQNLIAENKFLNRGLYYDDTSESLTTEDPKLLFYLRNLDMKKFAEECGFTEDGTTSYSFTFALSFAGEVRDYAKAISHKLAEDEVTVFYDYDHQFELLGEDVEAWLGPIYSSDSKYVVVLLDKHYPKKIWTTFENKQFIDRFGENAVIPILIDDYDIDATSKYRNIGRLHINTKEELNPQINSICQELLKKIDGD